MLTSQRLTRFFMLLALAASLAMVGCGDDKKSTKPDGGDPDSGGQDDGGQSGDDGGPTDTEYPFAEKSIEALCGQVANCGGLESEFETALILAKSADNCEAAWASVDDEFAAQYLGDVKSIEASIKAGRITVDVTALDDCFEAAKTTCGGGGEFRCAEALTPTVANGAACTNDAECMSGDCEKVVDACGGTCSNQAAEPDDEVVFATGGDPCGEETVVVGDDEQIRDHICPAGQVCAGDEEEEVRVPNGTCVNGVAKGEACDGEICGPGLICLGVCAEIVLAGNGEDCDVGISSSGPPEGESIRLCDWTEGLDCIEGECAPISDGNEGSPCRRSFKCDDGLYCDSSLEEPACAAKRAVDGDCNEDRECLSGYCNDDTEKCVAACP